MKKLLGFLMLFVFAAVMSYAAESTSDQGQAKAKIVSAATIAHQTGALDFGTIFKNTTGGTVTVQNAAAPAPAYSDVTAAGSAATSSDHFVLNNLDTGTIYSLAFTTSPITIAKEGDDTKIMSVALTLSDDLVTGVTTKDVYVGGTLTVNGNQDEGQYTGNYTVNLTY